LISHGSYPGMVYQSQQYFGFPYKEDPEQPEFGASWSNLWNVLAPRVQQDPLRYAKWYIIDKPVWLWSWPLVQGTDVYVYPVANSPYERQPVMAATHWLMRWLHLPVMLLAFAGAVVSILRRRPDPGAPIQEPPTEEVSPGLAPYSPQGVWLAAHCGELQERINVGC
jgi:hypothetical protein